MNTFKSTYVDLDITVQYSVTPPSKGATDGLHGPKIEPDDPGGIEIESVEYFPGVPVVYNPELWDQLVEEIGEDLYQQSIPDDRDDDN